MNNIAERKDLSQKIYESILGHIEKGREVSDLDKKKLRYGVQVLVVNVTKIIILLIVALLLNVFLETLIIWGAFASIRRNAFGTHSSNSVNCTIITLVTFVGGGLVSKYVQVPLWSIYIIYLLCGVAYFRYAPADTHTRPLVGKKLRKNFKIKTLIYFSILVVISLILNNYKLKILFAVAFTAEAISILPITYKILKRRYNNYEYFKKSR